MAELTYQDGLRRAAEIADFEVWINELRESVIEGEYGYEPGEFTVYPEMWRPLFDEGLTPAAAFKRALDAAAEERRREEAARQENWRRIQMEDAALLSEAQKEGG